MGRGDSKNCGGGQACRTAGVARDGLTLAFAETGASSPRLGCEESVMREAPVTRGECARISLGTRVGGGWCTGR